MSDNDKDIVDALNRIARELVAIGWLLVLLTVGVITLMTALFWAITGKQ